MPVWEGETERKTKIERGGEREQTERDLVRVRVCVCVCVCV